METLAKKPKADHESQVQNLDISHAEPLQLIKKNKNKKKNHMKQMEQRSHMHYAQDTVDAVVVDQPMLVEKEETPAAPAPAAPAPAATALAATAPLQVVDTKPVSKNPYGRAFITHQESERNHKPRNTPGKKPMREYPVHRMPTLFYADQGLTEDEMAQHQQQFNAPEATTCDEQQQEESAHHEEDDAMNHENATYYQQQTQEPEKPINYEQDYPEVNFENIPPVGTKLAIKTLELTAAYTPEISDWKQVILKDINSEAGQVTFEFLPGFGKATTKGGKFENKKKKRYDDWYEEVEEEEEEEEEEREATFEMTDIFAMRNMA
ncbi:uncharacterized protein EV154DRAFT_517154 [Mucor mucedo]|uniref:uncharacterized protein n=1 Tax=Mucor mucedo TaxID=29922 RepID=UPI00221FA903|nr:uncharacterized protein EV154DRAFT_517154 [Mucor mucedo]KAI7888591.1 hypothetical protein EV154DRAFT_517154 [Mucor mucedo]